MTELAKHGTKRFVTVTDKLSVSRSPIHIEIEFGNPDIVVCPVPVLLIHGDADTFVPCSMSEEIYKNCKSPKQKLIIHGAGHCESYYKDREAYEGAMDSFIGGIIE